MVDWNPHLLPPSPSRPPYIGDEQSESCEDDDEEEEEDIRERQSVVTAEVERHVEAHTPMGSWRLHGLLAAQSNSPM